MFKLGEKVYLDHDRDFIGYIIAIEAPSSDSLYTLRRYLNNGNVLYTVRCFDNHYPNGYCDFDRLDNEMSYADQPAPAQLAMTNFSK